MRKFRILVLLLLAILMGVRGEEDCGENCLLCYRHGSRPACAYCWKTRLSDGECVEEPSGRATNRQCGEEVCSVSRNSGCYICPGNEVETSYGSGKCVENRQKIEGCLMPFLDHEQKIRCSMCADGYPSTYGFECVDKEEGEMPPNCEWGKRNVHFGGQVSCFRCKEGYAVSYEGDRCILSDVQGCMKFGIGNVCDMCDGWNGYFHNLSTCKSISSS